MALRIGFTGRNMGYRIYGESKAKESPIIDFFIGLFIGGICLYDGGAWVAVSMGWITQTTMRLICCGVGVLIGAKFAHSSWRRIKIERENGKS